MGWACIHFLMLFYIIMVPPRLFFCFFGKLVGLFEYSLNFLMDLCDITKQKAWCTV